MALELDPIIVTVARESFLDRNGFYDRRDWGQRVGRGMFVTRSEIEKWRPSRISAMLGSAPGVVVECVGGGVRGCRVRAQRSPCPQMELYLDGVQMLLGEDTIDDFATPSDIAGVEIYAGIGSLPADFADSRSQRCGAVAIWTRRGTP